MQDAVVIILDVGPSMCQAPPGHSTSLETSVKAINMIIQRKVGRGFWIHSYNWFVYCQFGCEGKGNWCLFQSFGQMLAANSIQLCL